MLTIAAHRVNRHSEKKADLSQVEEAETIRRFPKTTGRVVRDVSAGGRMTAGWTDTPYPTYCAVVLPFLQFLRHGIPVIGTVFWSLSEQCVPQLHELQVRAGFKERASESQVMLVAHLVWLRSGLVPLTLHPDQQLRDVCEPRHRRCPRIGSV